MRTGKVTPSLQYTTNLHTNKGGYLHLMDGRRHASVRIRATSSWGVARRGGVVVKVGVLRGVVSLWLKLGCCEAWCRCG